MRFHVSDGQTIKLNSAKSLLIRQLVISFLYYDKILEIRADDADDVKIVHRGLEILRQPQTDFSTIDVKNCGAAERFLLAVASVTPGKWLLTGDSRLLRRPISPLISALQNIGADIIPAETGWKIIGKQLIVNKLSVDCTQSSQFASALALISGKIGLKSLITLPSPPPSAPYLEMTQRMIDNRQNINFIQREGDWSTAIFWYAFLSAQSQIKSLVLKDLRLRTYQGDVVVATLFQNFGIATENTADGLRIFKMDQPMSTALSPLVFDLSNHPDLAPVLAVTALLHGRHVTLYGLTTLNLKESRRLDVLTSTLSHFTTVKQLDDNALEIWGEQAAGAIGPLTLETCGDHRMAMAFALLTLRYPVTLTDTECVSKSYPTFAEYVF